MDKNQEKNGKCCQMTYSKNHLWPAESTPSKGRVRIFVPKKLSYKTRHEQKIRITRTIITPVFGLFCLSNQCSPKIWGEVSFASCPEDCQVGISGTEIGKHPESQVGDSPWPTKSHIWVSVRSSWGHLQWGINVRGQEAAQHSQDATSLDQYLHPKF